jgi:hypothetical protein
MRLKPFIDFDAFLAETVGQALRRLLVFDIELEANFSWGVELGVDVTLAGFTLAVGLHLHTEVGDLSFQVLAETPACGVDLMVGLIWPGTRQRRFEAEVTAALEELK